MGDGRGAARGPGWRAPAVLAGLAALLVVGARAAMPPAPLPADAPPTAFSAARAGEHVEALCRRPHPAGSDAIAEVRAELIARIAALGLRPEVQTGTSRGIELANVLVRVEGSGPRAPDGQAERPAVLLLCHHDSVGRGPGAGDDGAGVAAVLETLRALRAGPARRHDVIALFSDGEERGLLGARLFADEHPWAPDVAAVLNVEARGNAGPSVLFETGPGSGRLVAWLAGRVPSAFGSSAGPAVYAHLDNDTDFSVFRDRGLPGLNFALVGGASAYHQPFDSAANLRPASLQHHGEALLGLAGVLADADLQALPRTDRSYFVVAGLGLVQHPAGWDAPLAAGALLLLAVLLRAGVRGGRLRAGAVGGALVCVPLLVLGSAAVALFAWLALDQAAALAVPQGWRTPRGGWLSVMLLTDGLVLVALAAALWLLPRLAGRSIRAVELAAAALLWWAALLLLLLAARGASHLATWALVGGALSLTVALARDPGPTGEGPPPRVLAVALPLAPALALLLPTLHVFVQVGATSGWLAGAVGSSLAGLGLTLAVPTLHHLQAGRSAWPRRLPAGAGLALLSAAACLRTAGL